MREKDLSTFADLERVSLVCLVENYEGIELSSFEVSWFLPPTILIDEK